MPRRTEPTRVTQMVGDRVRGLRVEQGLTLGELASTGHISKGHLSNIERGLCALNAETAFELAFALSVRPMHVMPVTDDPLDQINEAIRRVPRWRLHRLQAALEKEFGIKIP